MADALQDGVDISSVATTVDSQQIASVSILLQILMLVLAFVLGHVLRRHKFYYLHEASAALLIGLLAGGLANLSNSEEHLRKWFNFHEDFFFFFLLPPIIFESGFSLQPKPFFSNFGAICVIAILGTFVASMVTGILIWLGGVTYLIYKLNFFESLIFGSIISATDPVTVLAIFQELGIDSNLYALVFGESVLNDAVAMSLYRTLMLVRKQPTASHSIPLVIWRFLETFVGSMSSGVGVALVCALLFKYAGLAVNNLQNLECCLIVLFPYFSYMVAESIGLSGIVSILFCGILMKHYTLPNLSEKAQTFTAGFFELVSSLAETFVFIYMGADIAIEKHSLSHVGFILCSILIIGVARAANVFPSVYFINLLRPASKQIPMKHQKALWFSGLRGAMAFALALQSKHDLAPGPGRTIFTTTTAIVILTVLLLGGSTSKVLEKLEVTTEESQGNGEGTEEETDHLNSYDDENGNISPSQSLQKKIQELRRSTSFTAIDEAFLKPFFTSRPEDIYDKENSFSSRQTVLPLTMKKTATESSGDGRLWRSPSIDATQQEKRHRTNLSVQTADNRQRLPPTAKAALKETRQKDGPLTRTSSLDTRPRRVGSS